MREDREGGEHVRVGLQLQEPDLPQINIWQGSLWWSDGLKTKFSKVKIWQKLGSENWYLSNVAELTVAQRRRASIGFDDFKWIPE